MSWVRIYVHLVFSTKNREPLLKTATLRRKIFEHIKVNSIQKNVLLDCVNGYEEHAHCLVTLGKTQSISEIAQLIKGESSHWINENQLTEEYFNWQDDYWAVGVSESHVQTVRNYIFNQEKHHTTKSFVNEINEFNKKFGWKLIKG